MHLSAEDITRYRDKQMTPDEILRLRLHADDCEPCRESIGGGLENVGGLRGMWEPHPDEQELVLFAMRRELAVARRAEVEEHLIGCARCRSEVAEMARLAPRTLPAYRWWLMAAAAALLAVFLSFTVRERAPEYLAAVRDGGGVVGVLKSHELAGVVSADATERQWMAEALRT